MDEGILTQILGEVKLLPLAITILVAAIPIAIWLFIFFSKTEKSKRTVLTVFGVGCLTAPALLYLQVLWDKYPNFNLQQFIEGTVINPSLVVILILLLFVIMEELIKLYVIKVIDKKTLLIHNINDAIRYSLTSALGFAFIENAYYLYQFYPSISNGELVGLFIFRSIFTACAHMIFTGVFGYHYGVGKFSMHLSKQRELTGTMSKISHWISRIFNIPLSEGFRQKTVMKGFFLAVIMHFAYNYILELGSTLPVILFVIGGYLYLQYLLSRKVGHLILTTDPTTHKESTIAKKDKEVVVELLGMWFKEKRFVDVMHVCERLLERDPDNKVVKIFKAKALDKMDDKDTYKKILNTVVKTSDDLSKNERNIIAKYTQEKEEFQKVKDQIKKQLKKEGREYVEHKLPETKAAKVTEEKKDGTFNLGL